MKRLAMVVLILLSLALPSIANAGVNNCKPAWKCQPPTPAPSATLRPTPSPSPTVAPTVAPTAAPTAVPTATPSPTPSQSVYTFDDEFNGTALSSVWAHHYHCCGTVTMDQTLSTVSGGYLHQKIVNRSGSWFADIIDTKSTFTQVYGFYEARMKVPKGKGIWPAFWLYDDAYNSGDEIDTMEECTNPIGQNGGNDASLLHVTVHKDTGSNQLGKGVRSTDLSLDFHVYGVDWRPTYIAFYLDGVEVWRETSLLISTRKALLLDLGVGGSWCSAPDSTTPSGAEMLVDWVRVRA